MENLEKHIENSKTYGVPAVVALNKFSFDTEKEVSFVAEKCKELGIEMAVCDGWAKGGEGAEDLAGIIAEMAETSKGTFTPVYDWNQPVKDKIEAIAKKIYGAKEVEYLPKAKQNLHKIERLGMNHMPVCIAKTQNSLSDDPKWLGRPRDFTLTVREIEIASGAGFVIPITGNMLKMPGLPAKPAAEDMDIDNEGRITGLS